MCHQSSKSELIKENRPILPPSLSLGACVRLGPKPPASLITQSSITCAQPPVATAAPLHGAVFLLPTLSSLAWIVKEQQLPPATSQPYSIWGRQNPLGFTVSGETCAVLFCLPPQLQGSRTIHSCQPLLKHRPYNHQRDQ